MLLWRCLFAIILVLIWYLSDYGQFWIQASCCLLCFLVVGPAASNRNDGSTQTDRTAEEENDSIDGKDETDTAATLLKTNRLLYPNVWKSLQQMFKCAYAQLVLPWYPALDIREQSLYTALLREFDLIMDQIICKARNFDPSVTSVGCIHIFTHHLRCAKQSEGSQLFSCKAEEMAVLRRFSDTLIRNLFPQHLWEPKVYHCALQEILATKALALVTLLSDPDILNRLLVCQLDKVSCESPLEERRDSNKEDTSTSMENMKVLKEEAGESPSEEMKAKKKGSTVKEKFSKLFKPKKGKKTKIKKKEKELMLKVSLLRRSAVIETDGASSCEDSNDDSEDSDVGSYTSSLQEDMMEFKLSYQMWLAGKWAVTVPNVYIEDEKLCFTVHLEEISNSENLQWDVKKTQTEIVNFYNRCKDFFHLPCISILLENTETNLSEDFKKEAIATFEHYLKVLVTDAELGYSQLVFKFLCPLHKLMREEEHVGGVWVLLGGIASFLTPGQDDDELSHLKGEEKPDEQVDIYSLSEGTPQHDELDSAQLMCMETLQRQYKETKRELSVTDSGYSHTSDHTNDYPIENQYTVFPDHPFDDSDHVYTSGSRSGSVGENLAHFAARTKVIPKIQPALYSSFDSDGENTEHYETDGVLDCHLNENMKKKEHLLCRKSSGTDKFKGKEKGFSIKEEMRNLPQEHKKITNPPNWGKHDVHTVVFEFLKEISGNSRILKIIKTALKPFMHLVTKKVNTFLKSMNPSEAQVAKHIDKLRECLWPEGAVPKEPSQSSEEKNETKEKAMHLVSSKRYPILNKTDVEIMFKILQDAEENKKLVYMLLSYLLKELLPGEDNLRCPS